MVGSGNVFADLGLADAEELASKLQLAVEINRLLHSRRLSQVRLAAALGRDVEIRIRPHHRKADTAGRIRVEAA